MKHHPNKNATTPLTPSDRELLHALLTVNNVGLGDRCRRFRRRRKAAMVAAALCLLAIVPATAANLMPAHRDYTCVVGATAHGSADATVASIKAILCTQ